ncbi:DNA cytosine methyltransferase [Bacillus sp. DTU_2020_1000418_1_SI_GHA_SEK_038]|uniref:DNA cytosine methyltransferase n=1 Tax=Bacillus sp. DTU_2020_1000418_1_SI_GHA_SEK_038 TaxID=3077585 RepID=UPI0028EB2261|nr:DNA cytosine methyltransferase [Bacillus sp. DTU_2020_1000418_1_SI_GHA_SEK_038]WNS74271.1 DNA cytosine methyltransferase [Bacillus sp. DTU_2020_1000418_1_SI_GHA_SEK_038]
MKSIELFAGIGGIALAAEWAGIETVAFCEREPFCQEVLNKHWPSVPIFDDVCTLNKQTLEERGVDIGAIELISGGFPCQPYSIAGLKKGEDDDRALWGEMFRIIEEIRPTWVVGENVANFANMGLDNALLDLESIGYRGQSFIIPAVAVNANHRRDRIFIVAHSYSKRLQKHNSSTKSAEKRFGIRRDIKKVLRNSNSESKLQTNKSASSIRSSRETWKSSSWEYRGASSGEHWENNQPTVCRVDDGISKRLDKDRLKALGNAVVPQQIYPIFKFIKQIHDMETQE